MTRHYAFIFEGPSHDADRIDRTCDHTCCGEIGNYRAPKTRQEGYYFFCLEHVRLYNASWNYFDGIPDCDLEDYIQNDVSWQRPTWPLHARSSNVRFKNVFDFQELRDKDHIDNASHSPSKVPHELHCALKLLDLGYPFTQAQLKYEFRRCVKKYHPDAHHDDHQCKEMMKKINAAYALLKKHVAL